MTFPFWLGVSLELVLGLAGARWLGRRHVVQAAEARLGPRDANGVIQGAQPLLLTGGSRAVVLVHGFGDTPQSLAGLAHFLHQRGFTVSVPLLPGHGRTVAAFESSSADEWDAAVAQACTQLATSHQLVALVGQSMGAALALVESVRRPDLQALVLLAPLLALEPRAERGRRWWRLIHLLQPVMSSADDRSIHDPVARAASRAYGVLPVRLLPELHRVVERARAAVPSVKAPVRVLQSREDNRVTVGGTEGALRSLSRAPLDLQWRSGAGHVLSVDHGHDAVWALVAEWIEDHALGAQARSA